MHSKPIELERDKYELNVTAVDDGSCCLNGEDTIHTSTAVVVVFITDVNDNKPVFKDCSKYTPKISEGTGNGHEVIKVGALLIFLHNFILIVVSPKTGSMEGGISQREKNSCRPISTCCFLFFDFPSYLFSKMSSELNPLW